MRETVKDPEITQAEASAPLPKLVDLTYSATTDPGRYDDLLTVWEDYMHSLAPEESEAFNQAHLAHFNRALEIFERIGRQRREEGRGDRMLDQIEGPAMIVDQRARMLQSNFETALPQVTAPDRALSLDQEALTPALAQIENGQNVALVPIRGDGGEMHHCAVVTALSASGTQAPRYLVLLGDQTGLGSARKVVQDQFRLSESETDVLDALVTGLSPEEIAKQRNVGISTIRTQVRKLLEKTGCRTMADLVRQGTQTSGQVATLALARQLNGRAATTQEGYARILTSDGRLLAYRDFGAETGRPVLFLHNMMGGAIWPRRMQDLAQQNNWRIIAPSRPGFGLTDSMAATDFDLVRKTALDMRAVLDHLRVDKVLVMGMMSSAGLAAQFARDHGDRTIAVMSTGHAGLMDRQMVAAMANPARTMAKTWFTSPTALRFLIRVAVASVDMLGPTQMLKSNFANSPPDARLLQDTDLVEALGQGLQHAIAQGGEAFSRDGYVALSDWSEAWQAVTCPKACLLGEEDRMYPVGEARRLMAAVPGFELKTVRDAGQYAFYSHFDSALTLWERLWQDGAADITGAP